MGWTTLQDDQVTNTNEVARDRDGVGRISSTWLNEANSLTNAIADAGRAGLVAADDHFLLAAIVVMMVMEGVEDTVSCAFDAAAEAVVMTLVVVVTHVVSGGFFGGADVFLGDFDVFARSLAAIFDLVSGVDAAAVFAFSNVDLRFVGLVSDVAVFDFDVNSVVFCRTVVAEDFVSPLRGQGKELKDLTVRV